MAKLASSNVRPSLSFHADSPPETAATAPRLSHAECVAILDDFNLESSHRVRTLAKQSEERLEQIERHWTDSIKSLDDRVKHLRLERFVDEFDHNLDLALSQLVREHVGMRPMGVVEQSARKRKRFVANSPGGRNIQTDDENDLFASTTSKKQRSGTVLAMSAAAPRAKNATAAPSSVTRNGSVVKKKAGGTALGATLGSPTSMRKPARLRLRPSTLQTNPPPSSSSNFVYRNPSSSSHAAAPPPPPPGSGPTPQAARRGGGGATGGGRESSISTNASSFKTISRKPRRGESIVIRSLNDSPLGEFVAEESGDDEDDDEDDDTVGDDDEGEEWDMMDKHEASKIEDPQAAAAAAAASGKKKHKNKLRGKGKPPAPPPALSQSTSTRVPSSSSFGISLPANAPSYDELKKKWKEEMLEKLKVLEESGDLQRKGLEGLLGLL